MSQTNSSGAGSALMSTLQPVPSLVSKRLPDSSQHDQLTAQAQKWVAQTFFGTLLKQMRNSPFKSKLFEGGRGGEAFQTLFDQRLADHMARGAGHKLVNAITRKIEAKNAYAKAARPLKNARPRGATQGRGVPNVPAALRA